MAEAFFVLFIGPFLAAVLLDLIIFAGKVIVGLPAYFLGGSE